MKRDNVQTVTSSMPVLVSAGSAKRASGRSPVELGDSGFIRVVTEADAQRWTKTAFTSPQDHALFIGITLLKFAWDEEDEFTAARAYEKLEPFVQSNLPAKPKTIHLGPRLSLHWGGWGLATAPAAYTGLVTDTLRGTRFIVWYAEPEERLLPGLYCPDRRTAVLAMGIMKRLRVCPKCDTPFVPDANNVDYCSVKHREAHRQDRFRWRRKQALNHEPSAV